LPRRSRARGVLHSRPPNREGARNAGCPMHPWACARGVTSSAQGFATNTPVSSGVPRAVVLTVYGVLSPAASVVAVPRLSVSVSVESGSPSGSMPRSASGPHVFPVRASVVVCAFVAAHELPFKEARPATPSAPDAAASTASHPANLTIAIRPSRWDGMRWIIIVGTLSSRGGRKKSRNRSAQCCHCGLHQSAQPTDADPESRNVHRHISRFRVRSP